MTFKVSLSVSQSVSVWQENKTVMCIYRAVATRSAQGAEWRRVAHVIA